MAVHDDSNGQKKKSSDALDEIPTFNVENMQNNTRIINYRFAHYTYLCCHSAILCFVQKNAPF